MFRKYIVEIYFAVFLLTCMIIAGSALMLPISFYKGVEPGLKFYADVYEKILAEESTDSKMIRWYLIHIQQDQQSLKQLINWYYEECQQPPEYRVRMEMK